MRAFTRFLILFVLVMPSRSNAADPTPAFPEFRVPGLEQEMGRLEELFRHHYGPRTNTTLWDQWLPMSTLWPGVGEPTSSAEMRGFYRKSLLGREIDAEGYVATQQHRGLAHSKGWPFPTWPQARGAGFHFSLRNDVYAVQLGVKPTTTIDDWTREGLKFERIDPEHGLRLRTTNKHATLTTPPISVETLSAPFVRLEWSARGLKPGTRPYVAWTTEEQPEFSPDRRVEFSPPEGMTYADVPVHRHPGWKGTITALRLGFESQDPGAEIVLKSIITAIDTRHPINNAIYVHACADYADWTGDLAFLRENLVRMRHSIRYALDEFDVREQGCVVVSWVGHDGRTGLKLGPKGSKTLLYGHGVGNNYWDLLPFGGKDAYATIYLFDALNRLERLERAIEAHPEWNMPDDERFPPAELTELSRTIRQKAGKLFWNEQNGRFHGWIDRDGKAYDYGFTSLNLEAIHYGFATREQARSILDWLDGKRLIEGDSSQGDDLYHWRFAPRATTKRNIETYCWVWSAPESIPWGGQVQDGGAVLGFSHFDLMARLKTNGPDDAWSRLKAILDWFAEVQAEGGYRSYYAKPGRGTLQGGGPPGGLGLDHEFMESVMVPQVMLYGFLGVEPDLGTLRIRPDLPSNWPSLTISNIQIKDWVISLTAEKDAIVVNVKSPGQQPLAISPRPGDWLVKPLDGTPERREHVAEGDAILVNSGVRLEPARENQE